MSKIYYDGDADISILKDKTIAVIGYGNQGRAQSCNLRDSGLNVIVGNIKDSYSELAEKDGFTVHSINEAAARGDVLMMLIPDEVQSRIYEESVKSNLAEGKTLVFGSGFNIHYGFIKPPKDVDVILVAPVCPGVLVRELYKTGSGPYTMIGVHQDPSGKAKMKALALAKGIGGTRFGVLDSSFAEEVETDLFTEVAGLGVIPKLLLTAYEVMVEAGYQPEAAYSQTFYELKFMGDVFYKYGLKGATRWSTTAQYMVMGKASQLITEEFKESLKKMLEKVKSGEYAREWEEEEKTGRRGLKAMWDDILSHPVHEAAKVFVKE